jgi:hypothetical protein
MKTETQGTKPKGNINRNKTTSDKTKLLSPMAGALSGKTKITPSTTKITCLRHVSVLSYTPDTSNNYQA